SASARRNDGDLHQDAGREPSLYASPLRPVFSSDPFVPYLVHRGLAGDIGEIDCGGQQARLVGTCIGQILLDASEDVAGLLLDRRGARRRRDSENQVLKAYCTASAGRISRESLDRHNWSYQD